MKKHGAFTEIYQKATVWLALNKALFAQMMYALPNDVTSEGVPTAATGGTYRMFDKEFMDGMSFKQQAFIMAHEIMHEMLMHKPRMGNRDHRRWNYSCDVKINNLLLQAGFERPACGVFDHNGETFRNKSEEFIYDFIEEEENKGKEGVPEDYEGDIIGEPMSDNEVAQAKGRLQNACEMHGTQALPDEMRELIEAIISPGERWHEVLQRYFTSKRFSGCDWTAMCRREYVRTGIVSPPFQSDSLGTVVISVDQSGSISEEILTHFSGHVNSILMECKPERIVVQYFDTEVHETEEFEYSDLPVELRKVCGGGTSFVDCCAKAEEHEASVHILLTDMYGDFPQNAAIPTVWASISGVSEAPFGDVVTIEME